MTNGKTVNKGVFNNEAVITVSGEKASFTNQVGSVLNNAEGGSSVGVIANACGGTVNDSGSLEAVAPGPASGVRPGATTHGPTPPIGSTAWSLRMNTRW